MAKWERALMAGFFKAVVVTLVALAFVAAIVMEGRDTTVFVPPPEAVAEGFARQIAARRYDRAIQDVDERSGITTINARLAGEELHATGGEVDNVEGEPGIIEGDHATASAVLITEKAGRVRYLFRFTRVNELWKIIEWRKAP
jgi:hypothetical protein